MSKDIQKTNLANKAFYTSSRKRFTILCEEWKDDKMQKREVLEFCNISFGCNCCNCELYVFVYFNFISNHEEQEAKFLQRKYESFRWLWSKLTFHMNISKATAITNIFLARKIQTANDEALRRFSMRYEIAKLLSRET